LILINDTTIAHGGELPPVSAVKKIVYGLELLQRLAFGKIPGKSQDKQVALLRMASYIGFSRPGPPQRGPQREHRCHFQITGGIVTQVLRDALHRSAIVFWLGAGAIPGHPIARYGHCKPNFPRIES
jgi:hypothetical protein